jgi:hypothetical protein
LTDLSDLEDRVEALLKDASNADFSVSEIDNAIRLALHDLSGSLPVLAVVTMDAVTDQWEYTLTATGLVAVTEVWYPYLATDASYKLPHPVKWRMLTDTVLLLECKETPDSAYDLRVFHEKVQTLAGLDGPTVTTLDAAERSVLVIGAAGYAAVSLARDKVDTVVFGDAVMELNKWGWARINEFKQRVVELGDREAAGDDARIGWWSADKWDD